jgi:hypothetical protein
MRRGGFFAFTMLRMLSLRRIAEGYQIVIVVWQVPAGDLTPRKIHVGCRAPTPRRLRPA